MEYTNYTMKIILKYLAIILAITSFLLWSCKKKNEDIDPTYDTSVMLQNIGNNIILPYYDSLKLNSENLEMAVNNFVTMPTLENLTVAQNAWKTTSISWAKAEMINFGPADFELLIDANMNAWPTSTSTIESNIANQKSFTGTSSKGLPALEYLLFSKTNDNASIVANYTSSDTPSTARKNYLKQVAENVSFHSKQIYQAWSPSGGNYLNTFIAATGSDINGSTGLLVNALVKKLEEMINKKVGISIGKIASTTIAPNAVQANISNYSTAILLANLEALQMLYAGANGQGLDDNLNFVKADYYGSPLSGTILSRILEMKKAIQNLTEPLSENIAASTEPANAVWTAGKKLLIVMKVDMPSQLGVSITFSSNDGD